MSISSSEFNTILSKIQNNQKDIGYQTQILKNYQQLVDSLKKENSAVYSTYYDSITRNSADSQQSKYVFQSSSILNNLYNYGFWIYLLLAVILCVVILRKSFNMYYKFILVAAILTYPFYIYPLEELSYRVSVYIWNLIISVAYNSGYGNTSIEYGLSSNAGGNMVSSSVGNLAGGSDSTTGGENGVKGGKGGAGGAGGAGSAGAETTPPLFIPRTLPPIPTQTLSTLQFDSTNAEPQTVDTANWPEPPAEEPQINGTTPEPPLTPQPGPPGAEGAQGAQGEQGPQGPAGPAAA
jgi:hypothetical protein